MEHLVIGLDSNRPRKSFYTSTVWFSRRIYPRLNLISVCIYIYIYIGGGFNIAASPMHFDFFYHQIVRPFNAAGDDVAFFFVEYTLTPCASYPTQLRQAVEAVRYVIHDTKRPASSVILGGDSAGGTLILSVLLHLSHPHPEIEPLQLECNDDDTGNDDIAFDVDGVGIDLDETGIVDTANSSSPTWTSSRRRSSSKLGGVVACSPWVSFRTDWPSVERNKYKDIIDPRCLKVWAAAYLNGRQSDSWSEPLLAPVEWWRDAKVEHVLLMGGSDEVLISSIEQFAKQFKVTPTTNAEGEGRERRLTDHSFNQSVNPDAKFFIGHDETHAVHIYSSMISGKEPQQEQALKAWLAARVQ